MSKEPELKARDKMVVRMTREGAVEENLTAGTEQRVSKRPEDAELVKPAETAEPSEALSAEEQKKAQMRRQQRQFQAEHAEDNDTQPLSETSVTEEKRAENPPQNAPEPLPSPETPFKPPTLEQHGVSSHTGTVIAETVVTHKLRKTSAVEAVDADAILTQAAETASAKPVSDDAVPPTKRMQKLERKSEKAHERLDAAREKLPMHKVLRKERVFDEETGKGKTRLHFEDELKSPRAKAGCNLRQTKPPARSVTPSLPAFTAKSMRSNRKTRRLRRRIRRRSPSRLPLGISVIIGKTASTSLMRRSPSWNIRRMLRMQSSNMREISRSILR